MAKKHVVPFFRARGEFQDSLAAFEQAAAALYSAANTAVQLDAVTPEFKDRLAKACNDFTKVTLEN